MPLERIKTKTKTINFSKFIYLFIFVLQKVRKKFLHSEQNYMQTSLHGKKFNDVLKFLNLNLLTQYAWTHSLFLIIFFKF